MMRIITGVAKGTRLATLPGDAVRPTTEMTKEGVFSAIQFDLAGRSFLDLFCGSGQMGLEAISRGANFCTFVDSSEESIAVARKNAQKTKLEPKTRFMRAEYGEFIKAASKKALRFDYIYADPPFEKELGAELIKRVIRAGILAPGGLLMIESASPSPDGSKIPEGVLEQIASLKIYKFSRCYVYFVRRKGEEE